MSQEMLVHILAGTAHVGEQGHAYWLELHMWQDRLVHIFCGTAHVGEQGHARWNCTCGSNVIHPNTAGQSTRVLLCVMFG